MPYLCVYVRVRLGFRVSDEGDGKGGGEGGLRQGTEAGEGPCELRQSVKRSEETDESMLVGFQAQGRARGVHGRKGYRKGGRGGEPIACSRHAPW